MTRPISIMLLALFLSSCVAETVIKPDVTPTDKPVIKRDRMSSFTEKFSVRAENAEKSGDLRKALQYWEIVSSLNPENKEYSNKIETLKTTIKKKSDEHFENGLRFYKKNNMPSARREFILALTLNNFNTEALVYLKSRIWGDDETTYTIKPGDTLKNIAGRKYNDQSKDFAVAYFNNLKPNLKLHPGALLKLPVIDVTVTFTSKETGYDEETAKPVDLSKRPPDVKDVHAALEKSDFPKAVTLSERMLQFDPSNKEARELFNSSSYTYGKNLINEEKYQDAIKFLSKADPNYKDTKENIATAKKKLAEVHYINGVSYFLKDKLDEAIDEWKITLSLDPNHPKAGNDMQNAKNMLEKLKGIK